MSIIKKTFFLSLLFLGLSLLFWGVYNLSFRNPQNKQKEDNPTTSSTPSSNEAVSLNNTAKTKIAAISTEPIISPVLSTDGLFINYFSKTTGELYQSNLDGSDKKKLSDKTFSGLSQAFWSPDRSKVILKIQNSSNPFIYFNLKEKTSQPIKKNFDSLAWNATSSKIFYKFFNSQSHIRSLNISNPDTSHWKKLSKINYRNLSIAQVPQAGIVSFWNTGDAYKQTTLKTISLIGENAKTIFQNDFGADYLWSPSGNKILISHSDSKGGYKTGLAIINYNGGEYANLDIPTFVSKCVWSKDDQTIYYALPGGIPDNSVLPNDYKSQKFNTTDTFWKINLKTREKSRLVDLNDIHKKYDASQLFLSQDESILFFVNRIDNKLYRINL